MKMSLSSMDKPYVCTVCRTRTANESHICGHCIIRGHGDPPIVKCNGVWVRLRYRANNGTLHKNSAGTVAKGQA